MNFIFAKALICVLAGLLLPSTAAMTQSNPCVSPPADIQDGTFESAAFTTVGCGTLANLSSGGWHVSHGTPNGRPGFNSPQAINMVLGSQGSEGVFTCVDLQPNTYYVVEFDAVSANSAALQIVAANGLNIAVSPPCQQPLPVPSSSRQVGSIVANNNWTRYQQCFYTGSSGYTQLWFYVQGTTSEHVSIDNVELRLDLAASYFLVNNDLANDVNVCVSVDPSELFVPLENSLDPDCVFVVDLRLEDQSTGDDWFVDLTSEQVIALSSGTLNLVDFVLNLNSDLIGCYDLELGIVRHGCGCDETLVFNRTVCFKPEEQCSCSLPSLNVNYTVLGNNRVEFEYLPTQFPGTDILSWRWDFGDGTGSTSMKTVHQFDEDAATVCLTVVGFNALAGECCEKTICLDISTVEQGGGAVELKTGVHTSQGNATAAPDAGIISVRPNPAGDNSSLEYQVMQNATSVNIQMFDMQGRRVQTLMQDQLLDAGRHTLDIDVNSLENGVYYIEVLQAGQSQTVQLIIAD